MPRRPCSATMPPSQRSFPEGPGHDSTHSPVARLGHADRRRAEDRYGCEDPALTGSVPGEAVKPFVKMPAGKIALAHVRVIDGTGAPAMEDRTLLIDGGRIVAVRAGGDAVPAGYAVTDLTGDSVMPGIVGMHDHQFYIARPNLDATGKGDLEPLMVPQMAFSSPRLYLASGVTTLRTTGSVEPYTDLNMKAAIDAGRLPGPHMDVTGPFSKGRAARSSRCIR